MLIEFCGCKNRCAEEDTGYTRPNERGACVIAAESFGNLIPTSLAEEIFLKMSTEECSTAIRQGGANMEDRVREHAPDWSYGAIETCLDEITRLCVDAVES